MIKSINRVKPWETNRLACEPNENSKQPAHPNSLIRVFAVRKKRVCANEDSDQTARMRWLIWSFTGRTCPNISDVATQLSVHSVYISDVAAQLLIFSVYVSRTAEWLGNNVFPDKSLRPVALISVFSVFSGRSIRIFSIHTVGNNTCIQRRCITSIKDGSRLRSQKVLNPYFVILFNTPFHSFWMPQYVQPFLSVYLT